MSEHLFDCQVEVVALSSYEEKEEQVKEQVLCGIPHMQNHTNSLFHSRQEKIIFCTWYFSFT